MDITGKLRIYTVSPYTIPMAVITTEDGQDVDVVTWLGNQLIKKGLSKAKVHITLGFPDELEKEDV